MTDSHYVDNKQLHEVLTKYLKERKEAELEGRPLPQAPDYVAVAIKAICDHLALKPIFSRYPFIEDMKGDGIQNCIEYLHNYNYEKFQNPFAYITQIAYWAFVRRIQREKRYLYSKLRYTQYMLASTDIGIEDDVAALTDWANRFTAEYEEGQKKAKIKKDIAKTPTVG